MITASNLALRRENDTSAQVIAVNRPSSEKSGTGAYLGLIYKSGFFLPIEKAIYLPELETIAFILANFDLFWNNLPAAETLIGKQPKLEWPDECKSYKTIANE